MAAARLNYNRIRKFIQANLSHFNLINGGPIKTSWYWILFFNCSNSLVRLTASSHSVTCSLHWHIIMFYWCSYLTGLVKWSSCNFVPVDNIHVLLSHQQQRAKKVVSNSPGLMDFAIRLVIFVLNLPDWQVLFLGKRIVINPANQKGFWG